MTSRIPFVPSATETLPIPAATPVNWAMPAVDSGNPDVTISHTGSQPIYVAFGAGAAVGPNAVGCVVVLPGYSVLFTGNAAVQAAAVNTLVQPVSGASATMLSVWSPGTALLTISRGTASAVQAFAA